MFKIKILGRDHNPPHAHVKSSNGVMFRVDISHEEPVVMDPVDKIPKQELAEILTRVRETRPMLLDLWHTRNPFLRKS